MQSIEVTKRLLALKSDILDLFPRFDTLLPSGYTEQSIQAALVSAYKLGLEDAMDMWICLKKE